MSESRQPPPFQQSDDMPCGMGIFHLSLQLAKHLKWKKKVAVTGKKRDLLCQGHVHMLPHDACSGSESLTRCASVRQGLGSAGCLANALQF